ncbi:MAG TPA: PAS domain-containing protein, partial [Holophaga sp.]|nr:PAS domain-containing protein [Holophaga sp.]
DQEIPPGAAPLPELFESLPAPAWSGALPLREDVREGGALFRALAEAMPDYLFVFSREGRFLAAHAAPDGALYLPAEAFLGRCVLDVFPGDLGRRTRAALEKAFEEGGLQTMDYALSYPGGTLHFEGRMVRITPDMALLVSRDVTARVQAEAGLQASRDHLDRMLERINDGFVALDQDWRFTYVNRRAAAMLHRKAPEELLGRQVWEEFPEGVGGPFHLGCQRAMESQQAVALEGQYLPWNVWFEAWIYPSPEGISAFFTEITGRKQSEAMLQTVTGNAPDLIIKLDLEGRIRYVNRVPPGRDPADVLGKHWLQSVDPAACPGAQAALREVLATSRPAEFEALAAFPGLAMVPYHCRLVPVLEGGMLSGLILFATDVTEQRRLAEQQRELELQVQHAQKMESLGLLAGGVAHDMNNVLGAILGLASACQQGLEPGSFLAKSMDTITRACERGRTLVGGLLDFARKDLAEEKLLDLNALLADEVRLLERTTLQRVKLELDLDPALHPVVGDPGALSHAVMNLCINAVDAMPGGGTLALRSRNLDPDQVRVVVADTGCGMPEEILKKVLDPFFTTKPQGQGTGLGLSIAYGTVKAHGGQMQIQSHPGQGTQVLLTFPASRGEVAGPLAGAAEAAPGLDRDFRILVVDDDELVRCSMEILLEALAMTSVMASSGEAGLALLDEGLHPDLVILDVNMPGMGGAGFLPRFRERFPGVPVLLVTGRLDQAALDLAKSHEGVEVFPKPFAFDELSSRLKAIAGLDGASH